MQKILSEEQLHQAKGYKTPLFGDTGLNKFGVLGNKALISTS
jgi:hypothetical protein